MKSSHIGTGIDFAKADEITQTRLNLPKRMYGLGIRRQETVNEAAWIGGMLLTLPRMIDSKDSEGNITPGFMSSLEPLLGAGSFDHGKEETRFEHLVSSESLLGRRFEQTWSKLQSEVSQDQDAAPEQGMLSKPSIAAGWLGTSIVGKGQRRLTRVRGCPFLETAAGDQRVAQDGQTQAGVHERGPPLDAVGCLDSVSRRRHRKRRLLPDRCGPLRCTLR
jgi:hypothetical protein